MPNTIRIVKEGIKLHFCGKYEGDDVCSNPCDEAMMAFSDTVLLNTSELSVNPCEGCKHKTVCPDELMCTSLKRYQAEQALLKKIMEMSK